MDYSKITVSTSYRDKLETAFRESLTFVDPPFVGFERRHKFDEDEWATFERKHREPIGDFKEEVDKIIETYLTEENYSFNEFVYDVLYYGKKIYRDLEDDSIPV